MSELYMLVYSLLDSVLVGEYGVLTRCRGMLVLRSSDLPDGAGWVDGLSEAEVQELWSLLRDWSGMNEFLARSQGAFIAAGIEPEGRRVLAWGLEEAGGLRLEGFECWFRGVRLELSQGGQAAHYALEVLESMMHSGACPRLSGPLHFGWAEEAQEVLRRCAEEAQQAHIYFPLWQVGSWLQVNPSTRGFGYTLDQDDLVWLVIEAVPDGGFTIAHWGNQKRGEPPLKRGIQA